MTKEIERLCERFQKEQKHMNEIGYSIDLHSTWAKNDLYEAALRLARAVNKHVAARQKRLAVTAKSEASND